MTTPRNRIPLRPLTRILDARAKGEDPSKVEAQITEFRRAQMQDRGRRRAEWRLVFVAAVFVATYAVIGARMGMLAATPVQASVAQISEGIDGARADILDRGGHVLATNLVTNALYAEMRYMIDGNRAATELARIFPDLDRDRLAARLTDPNRRFVWIRQRLSPEQAQAVHDIGEPGLILGPREMRLYPNGALAAHVLGGAGYGQQGVTAAEIIGLAGVEHRMDDRLRDLDLADVPLTLSIDMGVQAVVEQLLGDGMQMMNARGASAVVMDAHTGEIIAMASLPDYDPNDMPAPATSGLPEEHPLFNRSVQGLFELGSVMKSFAVAQALDLGLVTPDTILDTPSPLRIGNHPVTDYHHRGNRQSVSDIFVHSSNIGTARMAEMIGRDRQREFLRRLGFLDRLPIEVAESRHSNPIYDPDWTMASALTISYGHGLAISPVHLAAGFAPLVNGGTLVTPTILRRTVPVTGERIISPTTSYQMRQLMRLVVTDGTASMANVLGYAVGGKTGSANKPDHQRGGYFDDRVIGTFVGAFPITDPRYVIVVSLDEAEIFAAGEDRRTAGWTAVPVTSAIIERIAPMLGVRPVTPGDIEAALGLR